MSQASPAINGGEAMILIERKWAMPNRWTFTIPPVRQLLQEELTEGMWIDPFAGKTSPAGVTNDLNRINQLIITWMRWIF